MPSKHRYMTHDPRDIERSIQTVNTKSRTVRENIVLLVTDAAHAFLSNLQPQIQQTINLNHIQETHYRDGAAGTKFVPFALETCGALSDRSDGFLVECATVASRDCAGSRPSISLLCTWFRQRVSIALQRWLAHAIHARTLRLEQSMALLPPPPQRVPLFPSELHIVASFGQNVRLSFLSFLGYVVSLQARSCNEMGFPSFFNNIHFLYIREIDLM